jgi:hypothetical protein
MMLLKLATAAQAQARHESWKKRAVQLPRDQRPTAVASQPPPLPEAGEEKAETK